MVHRVASGDRDDQLVAANVIAEFGGAFDDERVFHHGFAGYRVFDGEGAEVDACDTPIRMDALEEATVIISGNEVFVLFIGNQPGRH